MSNMNPFELLGVSPDSDDKEIKAAYRKKTLECHPDLYPGDEQAEAMYLKITEARDMIDTEAKRRAIKSSRGITLSRGPSEAVQSLFRKIALLT